jgi:hypothetical protein
MQIELLQTFISHLNEHVGPSFGKSYRRPVGTLPNPKTLNPKQPGFAIAATWSIRARRAFVDVHISSQ